MIDLTAKKYFLFDLDGTLVDLEQLNYTCFRDTANSLTNKELSFQEYMTYMAGVGSKKGFEAYFKSVGYSHPDISSVVTQYRNQKEYYLQNKFDEVVSVKGGAKEFLKKARELGKKLAVGTSTGSHFAYLILEKSGLKEYFDAIVTVDDVLNTKPAPDIFNAALSAIKGSKPESVIFEDSANGVKSAVNTGIEFFVVHNKGKNDSVVAANKHIIQSYTELIPQLG